MKTQAWGWLAAAVLAAGLNASYHDGGLQWAHTAVNRIEHSSAAALALASGHVDRFFAEARLVSDPVLAQHEVSEAAVSEAEASEPAVSDRTIAERVQASSCAWTNVVARAQSRIAHAEAGMARFQAVAGRRQAELERFEAHQERFEARIKAGTDRLRSMNVTPALMQSLELSDRCQRIRVSVPRIPEVHISVPEVHVDLPGDSL